MKAPPPARKSIFRWVGDHFEAKFEALTRFYQSLLAWALAHRPAVIATLMAFAVASLFLFPFVGRDFFPSVDAGTLRLHVLCPPGTRIEQSEVYFQQVEDYLRQVIPASELKVIAVNSGWPNNSTLDPTGTA